MLGFVSSEPVIIGVVVGIPLVVMALVIAATRPRLPLPAVGAATLVAVVLVAVAVWAVFRPGPTTIAAGARLAGLPSAPATQAPPTSPSSPRPSTPPAPPCSPGGTRLEISATAIAFDKACLAAPADTAFTLVFDNQDAGIPHNVEIFETAAAQQRLGGATDAGDFITGPDQVTYQVPALPAGTYFFRCDLHPAQMKGDFVVA
jgi:plastocyanin